MIHTHTDTAEVSYHAAARYIIRFEPEYAHTMDVNELAEMYQFEEHDEYLDIRADMRDMVRDAGDMRRVIERGAKTNHPRYWLIEGEVMVAIAADGGIVSIMRPLEGVYNG